MKVFYDKAQSVANNESASPSAGKPAKLIELWKKQKRDIEIIKPTPLSTDEIATAHDPNYVKAILNGTQANGFGNKSKEIADSLPWTTGSFVSAAIAAIETREITLSPTSGFHHAGYASASGYCTFNGLVIAAQILKKRGLATKVGILDCDMHYGNGTDEIIKRLKLDFIRHWTFGGALLFKSNAEHWLTEFPFTIRQFSDCDIVLYQAGADPHIDDPLGGVLTSEQMRHRDRAVFTILKELGVPVAWNLAGGYQKPLSKVLELHTATLEEGLRSLLERG